jgi:hypothetical protein
MARRMGADDMEGIERSIYLDIHLLTLTYFFITTFTLIFWCSRLACRLILACPHGIFLVVESELFPKR